jgi:hypothetical protein
MGGIWTGWPSACLILAAFWSEPALAAGSYDPISVSQPLKESRGGIAPRSPEAARLADSVSCRFLATEPGGTGGDCADGENPAAVPGPGVDSAIIFKPVSDGKAQDRVPQDTAAQEDVAAVGVHAVAAALSSVKETKIAAIDLVAFAAAFGKKLVLLLMVVPFLVLKQLFRGRNRQV